MKSNNLYEPCEDTFKKLAGEDPKQLLEWMASGELQPPDLAFAAEIAGQVLCTDDVIQTLLLLLQHKSAPVREGAIYGINNHLTNSVAAISAIYKMSMEDESIGVREAAAEVIQEFRNKF